MIVIVEGKPRQVGDAGDVVLDDSGALVVTGAPYTYLTQEDLYERLVNAFLEQSIPCEFYFGWREPPRQRNSPRVVWRPGNPNGDIGELKAPRHDGTKVPRQVWALDELFTLELTAVDTSAPEVEILQYIAVRLLYDIVWRELRRSGGRNVRQVTGGYEVTRSNERRRGATIRTVGAILAAIPDRDDVTQIAPLTGELTEVKLIRETVPE